MSSSSKNYESIQSLKEKFDKWVDEKFTFLDLLISAFGEIDDSKVTNLTKHVNQLMTKNPNLGNIEFLIRSEKSIEKLCKRNVFSHFQAFFPNAFYDLISLVQKTDIRTTKFKSKEEDVFNEFWKYIAIKKNPDEIIFHHIDYIKCFNIALTNKNCEIAKFVIVLLRYYFLVWSFKPESCEFSKGFSLSDRERGFQKAQKVLNEFNQNLVAKYEYIFKNDLTEIIIFLLDIKKLDSLKSNKNVKSIEEKQKIEEITKFLDFDLDSLTDKDTIKLVDSTKKKENVVNVLKDRKHFLLFAQENDELLKHDAVREIFRQKWREEAVIKYYFDLYLFIVYVTFYTIYIECEGNSYEDTNLHLSAKYISLILAYVNLILEIFQCIMHILHLKFLQYIQRYVTSFRHIFDTML